MSDIELKSPTQQVAGGAGPSVSLQLVQLNRIILFSQVRNYKVYVAREVLHHGSLVHPFIVGLYEVFLTSQYLGIAMEYADGGDLFRYVTTLPTQRLAENEARVMFQQLIVAMQYMHGRGVANRDLKLENMLLSGLPLSGNTCLKVCDFGYSKHELNSEATTGMCVA